jgi:2-phospho-L-lactate/phosphoenolpyruvate guanylyltransferase
VRTVAILPVKGFASAKRRLTTGLSPEQREALAEAMFSDVLAALGTCTLVDEVFVVTRGGRARETAAGFGARILADEERGHNAAALLGIRAAAKAGLDRALLVPGDCPALDPLEVDQLLARSRSAPSMLIVPDRHGTGTNALLLTPPDALAPSFGPGSCERHARQARAAGVAAEVVEVPSLATDVDTPEDLEALESWLGHATTRAPSTRRLLSKLIPSSRC